MASRQRRRAPLDVATEMVGRSGWSALTMTGLAKEVGVSRQLVYDHFEDGTGLLLSTIRHLFEGAMVHGRASERIPQRSTLKA
jgi:AcrR family transcriptional regulator